MVMYDNNMIVSLKQKKRKFEPQHIYRKVTYSWNMQIVYQKKSRSGAAWNGGNDDISIVHARKYEMVRMT